MSEFPIFSRTMLVVVPTCAAVPIFGLVVGGLVGAFVMALVIRGLMQ